jgi:hypothetical protein
MTNDAPPAEKPGGNHNHEPLLRRIELAVRELESGLFLPPSDPGDLSEWICTESDCPWPGFKAVVAKDEGAA